jgi:signal transduction histidine kinase
MPLTKNKISILTVDDEPLVLDLIQEILNSQGYNVILANSAKEALNILNSDITIDLIISDVIMPEINGFEFYLQVQKIPDKNRIPFIFVGSIYEKRSIAQGKEIGADDYLIKPFTHEDLLSSITGTLKRSKKLDSSYGEQITFTKDRLLSMISHEFRTPLTTITGFSQLINEDLNKLSKPELRSFLELIIQSSKRLYTLVEDFIQSSSIETGEYEKLYNATKQKEKINDIIETTLQLNQNVVPFSIKNNISNKDVFVFVCYEQISIIIQKIIDNAIKFCYDNTVIEVSLDDKINFAEISIKNYGDGIPLDQQNKIFDKFYVSPNPQGKEGAGLGLFIANKLAYINKCTIEVESIEKSYTTFKIKIPVAQE